MIGEEGNQKHDLLYKLVMLGDHGVGKTQLVSRYTMNEFMLNSAATIGVEFVLKSIEIDSKLVGAQIWDTAGQEKYKSLAKVYYQGATGAILVYDITSQKSFERICSRWLKELKSFSDPNIIGMLIGNKCDLKEDREVFTNEATAFAKDNGNFSREKAIGLAFMETSAKDAINVDIAFERIFTEIYKFTTRGDIKTEKKLETISKGAKIENSRNSVRLKSDAIKSKKHCC
eukprot:TRINITY_DN1301_c0_g5_i2.p1 TRINITY_DN1301_c0_g5~~TRINITY_DN1301_c0_g5_i2.p1  ORF type:complete len:230 (+),score=60.44 TRINITY_DN1301_c0_g5_i2:205-894(+)